MTVNTNAYRLWLANELLPLIHLYNVYISITYFILPHYWIFLGITEWHCHNMFAYQFLDVLIILNHVSFTLVTSI